MGLFWQETTKSNQKPTSKSGQKAPASHEPVELKPYVARPAIDYQLMSDEELTSHAGSNMVFDIECFRNFFLIAFKHLDTQKIILFEHPIDADKLKWVVENYTCIGFNSRSYDMTLLWMAYLGASLDRLKDASDAIIAGERNQQKLPTTNHIDLIEVVPGHGSLKLLGARLHAKRIQDLPWANEPMLEDWQKPITINYCVNDLDLTDLIFNNLSEQLQLRVALSSEYHQDLMSKSDAQIAEAVIAAEFQKLTGNAADRARIQPGRILRFRAPDNLTFRTEYLNSVLRTVEAAEFSIDTSGYLVRPEIIDQLEVKIGDAIYRMGIGGLHSSEKCTAVIADDKHVLIDRDVASYYPRIMINCNLMPKNMGEKFLVIFKALVERRLTAKAAGDQAISESMKVTVNGCFGKTGSPFSILYAPEMIIQVTLGGQLYLLMLIELIEAAGIVVVSANTDGVVVKCPIRKQKRLQSIIAQWEQQTGFVTEETRYSAVYSRDVNAYLAVKLDGSVKGKSVYYDPWSSRSSKDLYWRFQKNPHCQICVEAVQRLIVDGVAVERTIKQCRDITRFVAIKNVTGGAHYNGEYLGKVVRWYYARDVSATINYIANNNVVGTTDGAKPLMDLPDTLPDDIDYERYIKRANDLLRDMGA